MEAQTLEPTWQTCIFMQGSIKTESGFLSASKRKRKRSPSTASAEGKLNPELSLHFPAIYLCIFTLPPWISVSLQPARIYCARFSPQGNSGNDVDAMWINLAHSPSAPWEVKLGEMKSTAGNHEHKNSSLAITEKSSRRIHFFSLQCWPYKT